MPAIAGLQMITFALERDEDTELAGWSWIDVKVGDTVQAIAARRGHLEEVRNILNANGLRSARAVLRHKPHKKHDHKKLKVPRKLRDDHKFHVFAGDEPPDITGGYAKLSIVDRPERVGLSDFDGYDPIGMAVPIHFIAPHGVDGGGLAVEEAIALLERMAGRGHFEGAAVGPPPIIRVSTTDNDGNVVPLIPRNYQWTKDNATGPLWRIAGIDWDTSKEGCRRNRAGNRIRQKAVVNLQQFTTVKVATRSVAARAKAKGPNPSSVFGKKK